MATVSDADEHAGLPQTAAAQLTAAARVVAQRAPATLTVARHRAQPTAATIARLTATAVFAYLIALPVPGVSRPVLAPLTALLVAQVSLYQTLRNGALRAAALCPLLPNPGTGQLQYASMVRRRSTVRFRNGAPSSEAGSR
jgi:hypothetical protein